MRRVEGGRLSVKKVSKTFEFKTDTKVPKVGLMMVGIGGNNGTTVCATVLANRHNISWSTKTGPVQPNYIGSLIRASTLRLGFDPETGKDVNIPFSDVLPMVHPNDLVLGGWDISAMPLDKAMSRAQVLDYDLQRQLFPLMQKMGKPLPSVYYPDFIAANQEDRADNLIEGTDKLKHLEHIRKDIRDFKAEHGLDKVVVLWTANTERYSELIDGVNDTADNLMSELPSRSLRLHARLLSRTPLQTLSRLPTKRFPLPPCSPSRPSWKDVPTSTAHLRTLLFPDASSLRNDTRPLSAETTSSRVKQSSSPLSLNSS
ncbi:Myo-inositol-1-phosphate synthase [Naganishia onofrii]|uniref:Myo-inositol-1-phosphate synthase n=1 Tax=Naganishia onofrii TaxID=1851511 RepID=A0ACC2XJ95_9TREE|nr:Myo-inositol-1-phosphate synthase [Naganishia onofrii]